MVLTLREILGSVCSFSSQVPWGQGCAPTWEQLWVQGKGKRTKQQQSAPEKLPAKISQAQTQCSGQCETRAVFSGSFIQYLSSPFNKKERNVKQTQTTLSFWVLLWGKKPFPSPSLQEEVLSLLYRIFTCISISTGQTSDRRLPSANIFQGLGKRKDK